MDAQGFAQHRKKHPQPRQGCPICDKVADPRYRKLWGIAEPAPSARQGVQPPCVHLGEPTGQRVQCPSCAGTVSLVLFECARHGTCTISKKAKGHGCCGLKNGSRSCADYDDGTAKGPLAWAYGVTTIPRRRNNLLKRTLTSLAGAGFDRPHLFVDGSDDSGSWRREFGLEVTCRYPRVKTAAHWFLSMQELYHRSPRADRFVLFQDDVLAVQGLREYLEQRPYPHRGYQNLMQWPLNKPKEDRAGWHETTAPPYKKIPSHNGVPGQAGLGAQGLVFSREAVQVLLGSSHWVSRPHEHATPHQYVDGAVVEAMNRAGWREYCHHPSLLQHAGHDKSSMGHACPASTTFPGEGFDATGLA